MAEDDCEAGPRREAKPDSERIATSTTVLERAIGLPAMKNEITFSKI
jgi:hypothetical protein